MDNEVLHKEIDLIQNVISRMANNSFLLKGWMVAIIVGVSVLTHDTLVTNDIKYFSLILVLPVLFFWYLDGFFLHKEKCYRKLYEWVVKNRHKTSKNLYSLDYTPFEGKVDSIPKIMFSKTLRVFYGIPIIIFTAIILHNILNG